MCGLVAVRAFAGPVDVAGLLRGVRALRHRGPDAEALWVGQGVGLAHARLAIVDRAGGQQPFTAHGVTAVVNGELYGHAALRRQLEARGHRFRGRCDAEVLVHLYVDRGLDALEAIDGEFAFALYDRARDLLICARDRFGVRSLVWHHDGRTLRVASEAKGLFALGVRPAWDAESVWQAFSHQYLHPDRTVFAGVQRLPPGHLLRCDARGVQVERWWSMPLATPRPTEARAGVDALREALEAAVADRLQGERAVGFQLSGGLDSSAVAALGRAAGVRPTCFTVRFPDGPPEYDESAVARATARHLGAEHHVLTLAGRELVEALPDALAQAEAPCINAHVAAKLLLARAVRAAGVRVLLTGEGADELLLGYTHLRADLGVPDLDDLNATAVGVHLPEGAGLPVAGAARVLGCVPAFLRAKATLAYRARAVLRADFLAPFARRDPFAELARAAAAPAGGAPVDRAAWLWTRLCLSGYFLPNLCEPTELASAVEGRLPFLDRRVFEVARHLPHDLKVRAGVEKWALREAVADLLPPAVLQRRKQPFMAPPLPVAATLRAHLDGPLPPFLDRAHLDAMLRMLPTLPTRERVATDPALMLALSFVALQRAWSP